MILCSQAIDAKPYNVSGTDSTWENCSLRKWLNKDFYEKAFSKNEQSKILRSKVSAEKNPKYNSNPGNDTEDNIFLLSIDEVEKYKIPTRCVPTDYAWKNGAYVNRFNKETNCWWWLRTQGIENNTASGVDISGKIDHIGNTNNIVDNCVRPAMWINLN